MTRDEIISGLEREIKSIRREPRGKMLGICMTADEAEDIIALLKEQEGQIENRDKSLEKAREEIKWLRGMMKEQESVPVIQREVMHMLVWCCGSCGVAITDGDKFCRMCGKQVKWK